MTLRSAFVDHGPVWRGALAPVVWACAVVYLLLQTTSRTVGDALEAYNRGVVRVGNALLRAGRRLLDLLGPLGRALRALVAPLWRRLRAMWAWLNVQVLLRMFRPLRRWALLLVERLRPVVLRLVARVRRVLAALAPLLEPPLRLLERGIDAVERAAARLERVWRRLWAPVLATVARWRRAGT